MLFSDAAPEESRCIQPAQPAIPEKDHCTLGGHERLYSQPKQLPRHTSPSNSSAPLETEAFAGGIVLGWRGSPSRWQRSMECSWEPRRSCSPLLVPFENEPRWRHG
jgi:hypothetical protein